MHTDSMPHERRKLRILALPAYGRRALNPFQALLYDEVGKLDVTVDDWSFLRALWRPCDIWHFHHPDTVVFPRSIWQSTLETIAMRLLLTWAKLRGIKLLWTVHDLDSSDNVHPTLERWFWRYFLPRLDGYICLTETGGELARARFPALQQHRSFTIAHGDFSPAYPNTLSRETARKRLGLPLDVPVMLNFGLIRPYKDVPLLIETVCSLDSREAILLVAGRVYDASVEQDIRRRAGDASNVKLHLQWIAFEETQLYFTAADFVILPYRRILNSGTLMLALAFDRPVMVPDRGTMRELQERFGKHWVRLYDGELSVKCIRDAVDWATPASREPLDLTGLDWATLARQTRAVYDELTSDAETADTTAASSVGHSSARARTDDTASRDHY